MLVTHTRERHARVVWSKTFVYGQIPYLWWLYDILGKLESEGC